MLPRKSESLPTRTIRALDEVISGRFNSGGWAINLAVVSKRRSSSSRIVFKRTKECTRANNSRSLKSSGRASTTTSRFVRNFFRRLGIAADHHDRGSRARTRLDPVRRRADQDDHIRVLTLGRRCWFKNRRFQSAVIAPGRQFVAKAEMPTIRRHQKRARATTRSVSFAAAEITSAVSGLMAQRCRTGDDRR